MINCSNQFRCFDIKSILFLDDTECMLTSVLCMNPKFFLSVSVIMEWTKTGLCDKNMNTVSDFKLCNMVSFFMMMLDFLRVKLSLLLRRRTFRLLDLKINMTHYCKLPMVVIVVNALWFFYISFHLHIYFFEFMSKHKLAAARKMLSIKAWERPRCCPNQ